MKDSIKIKKQQRDLRKRRIKAKIQGTAQVPRLCVYRSLTSIYAQLIDDAAGKTLLSFDSQEIKKGNKTEKAKNVGEQIAKLAKEKGIEKVVFDRCGFRYHGRVKALAEGAREGGLIF